MTVFGGVLVGKKRVVFREFFQVIEQGDSFFGSIFINGLRPDSDGKKTRGNGKKNKFLHWYDF
jgi:hypothetical protein